MVNNLRVTLVQTSLHWHDPDANRQQLAEKLASVKGKTDLIVLPEMFTSGFTNHPENLTSSGNASEWLLDQARRVGSAITGSVACAIDTDDEEVYLGSGEREETEEALPPFVNRLLFATPDGQLFHYDKVHLFRMYNEHKRYQYGDERCVIDYNGWRLLLTVCYDLRFPVFCRNRNDYDLMLCVANWPEARRHHWRTLLQARAIENQAYVVGVNRVGVDGKGYRYSGDSLAVDYLGELLIDQPDEWVETVTFDMELLNTYRHKFPAWQDADEFSLKLNKNK